ncbi:uncharacterized protein JCM10292_005643 [Rhodotorula paludigena]|uniref:uncharacterized protein n=1 Tax=Rhodotorula paludigena TaxID=86838 RepID=UPI003179D58C
MPTRIPLDERMRQVPDQAVLPRHELGSREWGWVKASLRYLHDQDHPTAATFAAILQYRDSEGATPLQKELHEAVDAVLGLTSTRQGGTTTLWDDLRAPYWPHVVARHEALAANKVPLPFVLSLQQILARTLACFAHLLHLREGWRLFDEDWVFVNRAVLLLQDIVKNGPDWHDLIQQHCTASRSLGHRAGAYTPGGRAASSAGIADTLFA